MVATGSAVISGQCAASLPAASPLGDKACDWAGLALCARGDVGEAPTDRAALCALPVSQVKALGPYGDRSTGAATLSLGRPQGRALAVCPGLGAELGGVWGGRGRMGRPMGSRPATCSAEHGLPGASPGQSCPALPLGQTLVRLPRVLAGLPLCVRIQPQVLLGFQEHDSFYFGI